MKKIKATDYNWLPASEGHICSAVDSIVSANIVAAWAFTAWILDVFSILRETSNISFLYIRIAALLSNNNEKIIKNKIIENFFKNTA